jgi:hypothetical protein
LSALYPGANKKLGLFVSCIVFNALALALDKIILAFTLLAEACKSVGTANGRAFLKAVGILCNFLMSSMLMRSASRLIGFSRSARSASAGNGQSKRSVVEIAMAVCRVMI